MGENKSLVDLSDLAGLAKPAKALIEKISSAAGILYEPIRIRKKAQAEADAEIIKAQAKIDVSDLENRGLKRLVQQQGIKQKNIETITSSAIQLLDESANPMNIENDWLANFYDKCEDISDHEMQSLWSKILAGEANKPGTFSKRTINSVNSLDKREAHSFTALCGFGWTIGDFTPLVYNLQDDIYSENGVTFDNINHLASIGLISYNDLTGYTRYGLPDSIELNYFGTPVAVRGLDGNKGELRIGKVLLTQIGKELAPICGSKPVNGFVDYVKAHWKKSGIQV